MNEPRLGKMYDVGPAAWTRFRENNPDAPVWTRPQPMVNINPATGRIMLAFPYYWWELSELRAVPEENEHE